MPTPSRSLEETDAVPGRPIPARGRGAVVEVMGPAGAGKTSLAQALARMDPRVRVGFDVARRAWFPRVLSAHVRLLPPWLARRPRGRWFTWNELKSMAFLEAWLPAARRAEPGTVTVVDHGPVYRLARLAGSGPEVVASERFRRWWDRCLVGWLDVLDLVVHLDAPDEALLERVERRGHWFLGAERPQGEKRAFLDRYRAWFEAVLASADARLRVLRLRSDRMGPEDLAREVLRALADLGEGAP
mgnify:CR=1 FL=1